MTQPVTTVVTLLRQAASDIESELRGSSMAPALMPGVRIRIRCGAEPRAGDVVAYFGESPVIAHRVISRIRRRGAAYVMTSGDANWFCDAPIAPDRVLGVVTAYLDGATWRPVPAPPPTPRLARVWSRLSYWLVATSLFMSDRYAMRASFLMSELAPRIQRSAFAGGAPS